MLVRQNAKTNSVLAFLRTFCAIFTNLCADPSWSCDARWLGGGKCCLTLFLRFIARPFFSFLAMTEWFDHPLRLATNKRALVKLQNEDLSKQKQEREEQFPGREAATSSINRQWNHWNQTTPMFWSVNMAITIWKKPRLKWPCVLQPLHVQSSTFDRNYLLGS